MSKDNQSLELLRHQLGSIDLKDIEEKEMSEVETKEYNAAISAVFPRLEKEIKKFLQDQLLFMATNGVDMEQIQFARGTFNGLNLLLQHWKQAHIEHTSKIGEKEDFDKHKIAGEF